MKISLHIPMDVDDPAEFQNGAAVRAMAQAIERTGVDACSITDHPAPTLRWRKAGGHDALDPFTGLAFAAAATTRLRLHTNLVVLPYRNPFVTAKSAATLDVLSDGRLILGVGMGYLRGEYQALGADFDARNGIMDEALQVIRMAWSDSPVTFVGRHFSATEIWPRPRPRQQPHPPIWIGGNTERSVRRAVEYGDGWSPFFATGLLSKTTRTAEIGTLEELGAKIDSLRSQLNQAGRARPFDIRVGPREDPKACNASEAQRMLDEAAQLAALGVNWFGTTLPHPSFQGFMQNVHWFGELVPRIHALIPADLM
jgi:probable F420-dependent oxidoreductase